MKGAYNEGLGGAKTIRGIERNRVVGDGIAYGNFELRYQFWYFSFINQNWYMALSGFFDTGRVIQYINVQDGVNPEVFEDPNYFNASYLNPYSDGFHSGYGAGLHIGMNQNFIIAIDYGRALSADDGNTGFYVGLNWLF
jgi:hemolysin activation/secretion protein